MPEHHDEQASEQDRCECGHVSFMHGDVAGDTGCRREGCPCASLHLIVWVCPTCRSRWTADVAACPRCPDVTQIDRAGYLGGNSDA